MRSHSTPCISSPILAAIHYSHLSFAYAWTPSRSPVSHTTASDPEPNAHAVGGYTRGWIASPPPIRFLEEAQNKLVNLMCHDSYRPQIILPVRRNIATTEADCPVSEGKAREGSGNLSCWLVFTGFGFFVSHGFLFRLACEYLLSVFFIYFTFLYTIFGFDCFSYRGFSYTSRNMSLC